MYGSVKNDLILAPECRKCTLRGSDFKRFLGEHAPRPPKKVAPVARVTPSPPTSIFLPPTLILIENPDLGTNTVQLSLIPFFFLSGFLFASTVISIFMC